MRTKQRRIKYLTEQEISRLFKAIDNVRDRALLRTVYHRGLRASEVGMIQMSDLDLRNDRIEITRLKGSNGGTYHLCRSERLALHQWIKVRGTAPGALFKSRQSDGITRQRLDQIMRHYAEKAGLPPDRRHLHCLKHSCGTHLLDRGESLEDVQDHLGHRSITSTTIYAAFTNQRRRQRESRLDSW